MPSPASYQNIYAVGVNWYPNSNIRFMFDFIHGDISKRFATARRQAAASPGRPAGTPVGGSFDALAMRGAIRVRERAMSP